MSKNLVILLMIGFVLIGIDANAQCAMCRTTIESTISNGRSNIATGLNTGILYLLTAPYLAVAVIAFLWFRQSKKYKKNVFQMAIAPKGGPIIRKIRSIPDRELS